MTRLTTVQTNFSSGEIDPRLRAQTTIDAYNNGARRVRNLARLATGGVESRPPTLDLAELEPDTRLVDFEFSSTQRYVVAIHPGGAAIYDTGGALLDTVVGGFWDATIIPELGYSQNADTMIITHHDGLALLKRVSFASFTLASFVFDRSPDDLKIYQPYYKFADDAVTIEPSAATGAGITLQASDDVFVVGHVGQRFRIFDNEVEIVGVTDANTATADVKGKLEGKLDLDAYRSKQGTGTVEVLHPFHGLASGASITLSGANGLGADDTGANGLDAANVNGTFAVTVVDELRYSFTAAAADTAAVSEDGGGPNIVFQCGGTEVTDWREPSIGAVNGYPGTACFHGGRLWLAGTPMQPDGYWGSNALKPFRFDVGRGYDGDSVQGAAGLESISNIRHLISNDDLLIFTPVCEGYFVTRPGEPITPDNQRINLAGNYGCGHVMPQVFDGAVLYVQENGLSVTELSVGQSGRYLPVPVSTLAGHMLELGAVDSAVSSGNVSRAEQYAFFPVGRADIVAARGADTIHDVVEGDLAVFHSMRSENIAGWALWRLGAGKIRSTCAIGAHVFHAVERDDGSWRLYRHEPGVRWQLDGAVVHDAVAPTADWTLDARVRGREVGLYCERGYLGTVEVPADGVIETALEVEQLVAGDPYLIELETLTPRVQFATGSRDRLAKRILRAVIELDETTSIVVEGRTLSLRQTGVDPAIAIEPFSGPYEFRLLGFRREPSVRITQAEPVFARILGMTMEVKA